MGKHDPLGDIKASDSQLRADAQAHHKPISKPPSLSARDPVLLSAPPHLDAPVDDKGTKGALALTSKGASAEMRQTVEVAGGRSKRARRRGGASRPPTDAELDALLAREGIQFGEEFELPDGAKGREVRHLPKVEKLHWLERESFEAVVEYIYDVDEIKKT